jgi:apolipoprotein N-acyltransferase
MNTESNPSPKPVTSNLGLRFVLGIFLSALSALMLILAFHPYNVWFLAFFALIPMRLAEQRLLPVKWSGLAAAIGVGGWLFVFLGRMFGSSGAGQVIQIVVAVIIVIQVFAVPSTRRFHERTGYRWLVLEGVTGWVGTEMIRSFIPPINTHAFIAQTMYTQPWMLQPISIFSIYGLSALIVLINYALLQGLMFLMDRKWPIVTLHRINLRPTLGWLSTAGFAFLLWVGISGIIGLTKPENPQTIRVAAIQHDFPVPGHQDTPESQIIRLQVLTEQSRSAAAQGAQLIVWPELGLGFDPQVEHTAELRALATETGAYLLIGYGVDDPRGWRNEMVMLSPAGEFMAVYGKNHNTSPGEPHIITSGVYPVYDTPFGRLATIICNDVHFTDTTRRLARSGAQLVAVPTLEIPGIALEQVAQSVMRAVENRVAVVKADVAYASVIIDPYGRIVALKNGSPEGAAFALVADVPLGTGKTFYNRLGFDWVGWLMLGGFVFFIVFPNLKKKAKQG